MTRGHAGSGLRSLVLTRTLPTPLRGGADLRLLGIVRALGTLGPVSVFGLGRGGAAPSGVAGWDVASDPAAALSPEGTDLAEAVARGESPFAVRASRAAADEVAAAVRAFAPDLVVIGGLELARYAEILRPHVARLVVDLDYARGRATEELARADRNRRRSLLWRHAASRVAAAETDLLRQVDQVWFGHAGEVDRLAAPSDTTVSFATVPNAVDAEVYPRATREDPDQVVFPARFDFWPNEDAARVLVDEIAPRLPTVRFTLVGQAPPEWLTARADAHVVVTGSVPDVRPYLAGAAAMPVPLHAGSGTRFKVLEAFAAGLPVVSTMKGIEGLGLQAGTHYLRAETAAEFAAALDVARHDSELARTCVAAARDLLDREFSQPALTRAVTRAVEQCDADPAR
jgi:glycosyltransferase involved in cell wall biosynthesis